MLQRSVYVAVILITYRVYKKIFPPQHPEGIFFYKLNRSTGVEQVTLSDFCLK